MITLLAICGSVFALAFLVALVGAVLDSVLDVEGGHTVVGFALLVMVGAVVVGGIVGILALWQEYA